MVKCFTHGLRGFNGAIQRRLATLAVTMLISSCWQLSSEVELSWANSGSHEFVKKNLVHTWGHTGAGGSLTARVKMQHSPGFMLHFYTCSAPTTRFGLLYRNILFLIRWFMMHLCAKENILYRVDTGELSLGASCHNGSNEKRVH